MKPFSEQDRKPPLRRPHEYGVVVLGVLHPSIVPPPCESSGNPPQLPLSVVTGKRSTDVLFYDPISSQESVELNRQPGPSPISATLRKHEGGKTSRDSQEARRKAIAAVVHELDRLSMKLRGEKCQGEKE